MSTKTAFIVLYTAGTVSGVGAGLLVHPIWFTLALVSFGALLRQF